MDATEQVAKFNEFFKTQFYKQLVEVLNRGEKHLVIPFNDFAKFNVELAEALLEDPENVIQAAKHTIEQMDLGGDAKGFEVRFADLPQTSHIMVRNIRSQHIGKFLQLEGIVRQKTDVRPQVTAARFECPSCGNIIPVLQLDQKFREPHHCASCGRKGNFRLNHKELVDAQKIVLEEAPEDMEGGEQPKRLNIFLKNDLVSPITDKKTNPGSKVRLTGVIKEVPIVLATGGKSTRFDLVCESNYVEPVQEEFSNIVLTPEEIEEIKDASNDPQVFQKMTNSIAPTIYGHERVKEALLLQLFSGIKKTSDDGVTRRGDIHILLIGDPGAGKSQLVRRMSIVAPKSRFISGKGASGAGLTASVVKDEFLRGWALEAGALVLANKGIACIDEMDKMTPEDTSAMHEALEQQSVTISKANIQATLRCETTVLAAANPKFGRFDPYELIAKQIEMPSTLINRFDLIFPMKDLPDPARDDQMASFILELHRGEAKERQGLFGTDFIRKYIAYAKQHVRPELTNDALEEIRKYYVQMRNQGAGVEGSISSIPISARQLEALVRLAEASAKTRLAGKVTKHDAKRAVELVHYCLSQIGLDPETGKMDIDRITTGITAAQRSNISIIKDVIGELENAIGKLIPVDDVVREAEIKGVAQDKTSEIIERLKRSGDLFSPKNGFISKI
ncbi:minichromosome maintenance protein MCM [Candidatus Woesearchaeota archaeon]|nr:minichromosome maintenance protein MCM [Candidatus Woesearchaeota archaeon]